MKKVLIVDDSPIVAKLTQKNVEKLGYEVAVRENSTRAISYVGNHKIDIILMDIELMDSLYDGIQTAKLIRTRFNIPVIFITGHDDIKVFEKGNIEIPFDVVVKPYDIKQLKMQMEVALYNSKIESKMRTLDIWFRELLLGIDEFVFFLDQDYKIVRVNSSALRFLGMRNPEVKGRNLFEIILFSKKFDGNHKIAKDILSKPDKPVDQLDGNDLYISCRDNSMLVSVRIKTLKDDVENIIGYAVILK